MSNQVNLIIPVETCRANLYCIQETLDKVCPTDEPTQLLEHIGELASLIGLSALTQSSLRFHVETQMSIQLPRAKDMKFPPSLMKDYAQSCIPELISNYELAERLNRAITHKIDAHRSCLSYLKAENFHSNSQAA